MKSCAADCIFRGVRNSNGMGLGCFIDRDQVHFKRAEIFKCEWANFVLGRNKRISQNFGEILNPGSNFRIQNSAIYSIYLLCIIQNLAKVIKFASRLLL